MHRHSRIVGSDVPLEAGEGLDVLMPATHVLPALLHSCWIFIYPNSCIKSILRSCQSEHAVVLLSGAFNRI
jgi:hypothetical protein